MNVPILPFASIDITLVLKNFFDLIDHVGVSTKESMCTIAAPDASPSLMQTLKNISKQNNIVVI